MEGDMSTPFTEEQQKEIKEQLFHAGIHLLRTLGVQRMTVSKLTSACKIAKGSFYIFFTSKEDFVLALIDYAGQKTKEMLISKLSGRNQMSAHEFFQFLREYLYSEYDLMSGLTINDFMWLKTHMSDADLFNPRDQLKIAEAWLSLISNKRAGIDYGTVVNMIKCIYAMREHRDTFAELSLDNSIEMILRAVEIYVSGTGDLL